MNYTKLASATVTMANNTFIGMAVTSHNVATTYTATFDNVSVT